MTKVYKLKNNFSAGLLALWNVNDVYNENMNLKEERSELLRKIGSYDEIKEENGMLKGQSQILARGNQKMMIANILNRFSIEQGGNIVIDVGLKNGIKKDSLCIYNGMLVGKVLEVNDGYSIVQPITSNASFFPVVVKGDKSYKGLLKGGINGTTLEVQNIVKEASIKLGDSVLYAYSIGSEYYLYIGEVSDMIDVDNQVYKNLKVKSAINLNDINKLFVIL